MNTSKLDKSSFFLTLIFVVAASLIFFLMGLTYKHLTRQSKNLEWMTHSYEVSMQLETLYSDLKDIETERRNFILTKDESSKHYIERGIFKINGELAKLKNSLKDNPEQLEDFGLLNTMVRYKYKLIRESFTTPIDENNPSEVKKILLESNNVMASIHDKIEEMLATEKILLEERRSQYLFTQKSTPVYLYVISIFSLGLLSFAFYKINKDNKRQKQINNELAFSLSSAKLAENVGDFGIWTYNTVTKNLTFSDNFYRILGFKSHIKISNFSFLNNILVDENPHLIREKMKELIRSNEISPFITKAKLNNGEVKYIESTAKTITGENEEPIHLGISRNVTADVINRKDLDRTNKELIFHLESSKEAEKIGNYGFWEYKKDEDKFWFSDNLFRIFGFNSDLGVHQPDVFLPTIHPEDEELVKIKINKMYSGEFMNPFMLRIYRANDGELRYLSINNRIIKDSVAGTYIIFFTKDVTNEIIDHRNLEEQNRALEINNKELQAFNYAASHDLQEPLRKIEVFISRLMDNEYENLSDSGKQYLEKTNVSAGRMRKLIDDLLQFSRTTKSDNVYEITDLNAILEEAKEELQTKIEEKNTVIQSDKLPNLKVIPYQIKQLFVNLLSNSLKYSQDNIAPEIRISVSKIKAAEEIFLNENPEKSFFKISFSDNGIGFDDKYADKIFQLFHRLHARTQYEGTGIGLAICKKITQNHKGYITATSEIDKGSVFTVFLPEKL